MLGKWLQKENIAENEIPKYQTGYMQNSFQVRGPLNLGISLICILWAKWSKKKKIS